MTSFEVRTWSKTEEFRVALNTWEGNILRNVYGPVTEEALWRIRTNQESRELYRMLKEVFRP
jgi:hypothetical protein